MEPFLIDQFSGEFFYDEPLSKHTYYKIGGNSKYLAIPKGIKDLILIKEFIKKQNLPYFIFGFGSNLLCRDSGFSGVSIKMSKFDQTLNPIVLSGDDKLFAGASVSVHSFLRLAAKEGYSGLEFLSGIPGNIGGAIAMNAGTYLGESSQSLFSYDSFSMEDESNEVKKWIVSKDHFEYRKNKQLKPSDIILNSVWNLKKDSPEKVKLILDETLKRRKETQPLEFPSCGSVFKNPKNTNLKAWEVVDQCGLRGRKIGNAQISEKHPNWIINLGNASSKDVIGLIELCKKEAQQKFGVVLEAEVKILG